MDFKATFARALQGELGRFEVTFTTTDKAAILKLKTIDPTKALNIEVKEHREKRSLDANAYFHVLCNEIAKETRSSMDEVKTDLVLNYGAIARLEDGAPFRVCLPKGVKPFDFYPYARWIGENKDGRGDWYILYKHTHTLDTKEMARLIDGTIDEAKRLGIETRTPDQIAEMKSLWGTEK
jgi:hypothetical protein